MESGVHFSLHEYCHNHLMYPKINIMLYIYTFETRKEKSKLVEKNI